MRENVMIGIVIAGAVAFVLFLTLLFMQPSHRDKFEKACIAEGHFVTYEKGGTFCVDSHRNFIREYQP